MQISVIGILDNQSDINLELEIFKVTRGDFKTNWFLLPPSLSRLHHSSFLIRISNESIYFPAILIWFIYWCFEALVVLK